MLRPAFMTSPFRGRYLVFVLFFVGLLGCMVYLPLSVNASQTFSCNDGGGGIDGYTANSECAQHVQTYNCTHDDSPRGPIDTLTCEDTVPPPGEPTPVPTATPIDTDRAWPIVLSGDWGHEVTAIQKLLRERGYDVRADGDFGPNTLSAVEAFQRDQGLDVDGIVGPQTWERLVINVGYGDANQAVAAAQRLLIQEHDYWDIPNADGNFGPATEAAVRDFQYAHDLPPNGRVDANTWAVLVQGGSSHGSLSADAEAQMDTLLDEARYYSDGQDTDGRCYAHVADYIDAVGYGNIGPGEFNDYIPSTHHRYAHQFGDYANENLEALGLRRLDLDNPHEAPPGAIIVVRAGAPGTYHATAGDISIAGRNGEFYNGGMMGYKTPEDYPPGNDFVIGIYVPDI